MEITFPTKNAATLYQTAKGLLGTHQTLDPDVKPEVGCAEAVSAVLKATGIKGLNLPVKGIAGTADLAAWLASSPTFLEVLEPENGCLVVSPTGLGNGTVRGHTGILGAKGVATLADYGIMSNDSNSGLFLELWTLAKWKQFYGQKGGLPVRFFRLK